MADFEIKSERTDDGVAIVEIAGELDLYTAPQLKETLLSTLDNGVLSIVVDMTAVNFIDSSALGVLIGAVKRLHTREGRLALVSVDENVNWIFKITGLNSVFDIYPSRDEALGSFNG